IAKQGGDGRVWDLANDVADSILAGNPHPDRYGNGRTWSFVKGPTRQVGAGTPQVIPPGSLLDNWRRAAFDPANAASANTLSGRVQSLLAGPRPTSGNKNDPNKVLYEALASPEGPLLRGLDMTPFAKPKSSTSYGVALDLFGADGSL